MYNILVKCRVKVVKRRLHCIVHCSNSWLGRCASGVGVLIQIMWKRLLCPLSYFSHQTHYHLWYYCLIHYVTNSALYLSLRIRACYERFSFLLGTFTKLVIFRVCTWFLLEIWVWICGESGKVSWNPSMPYIFFVLDY